MLLMHMKLLSVTSLLMFNLLVEANAASNTADHVGDITVEQLFAQYPKFSAGYDAFQVTPEELSALEVLDGKEVIVLFATWCHDSQREVPRLLRLLDESSVDLEKLTLYGLDRRKRDPAGFAKKFALRFTPTIVVLDDGLEVARVIERPRVSLASDIAEQIQLAEQ